MSLRTQIEKETLTHVTETKSGTAVGSGSAPTLTNAGTFKGRIDFNGGDTTKQTGTYLTKGDHVCFAMYEGQATSIVANDYISRDYGGASQELYRVLFVGNPANFNRHLEIQLERFWQKE